MPTIFDTEILCLLEEECQERIRALLSLKLRGRLSHILTEECLRKERTFSGKTVVALAEHYASYLRCYVHRVVLCVRRGKW